MEDLPIGAEVILRWLKARKKNVMDAYLMSWIQIFLKMFVSVSSVRLASEKTEKMFNSKE